MKVAFDTSPLINGHKIRGIGSYTQNIFDELQKQPNLQIYPLESKNSKKVDIIHYPYFDLFFHTLPIKNEIKKVVTIHDVIPLIFPKNFPIGIKGKINLFLQKKALNNVNAVICDSETSKRDVIKKLQFPADKIYVVYLAPGSKFKRLQNSQVLKETVLRLKLPQEFILYVGDVNWNKNIPNLLQAVKIAKCNLVMVGKSLTDLNIPQSKEIDNQIKKLGIEKNIKKTGYVSDEDLATIYNLAVTTVLPSFYEGFGLSALESMSCGTPVICSNNSSLSEITGGLANYCDPNSPEDIAEKIKESLRQYPREKKTVSDNLINHASKYSWNKAAKETIKVYETVFK